MRKAAAIRLSRKEKASLEKMANASSGEYRMLKRARIILLSARGKNNIEIMAEVRMNKNTISKWISRFHDKRLPGLSDLPGRGRKDKYEQERKDRIIQDTIIKTPANATHWSTRKMAEHAKMSHATIWRIWKKNEIKPHILRTFKLSNDPNFEEKLRDVVGLYMNPPEHSIVLCVDEKSQIQALDRTQPGLPLKKGRNGTWTHDYVRHGTCTLFAALNYLEGKIIGKCTERHRHQEYLAFLKQIDRETPAGADLHLIVDNYCTHKHGKVKKWISKHPRFHVHFIPTSSSWLNLVERFFGKITQDRIRRGVFKSVFQLVDAIHAYIDSQNCNPKPFTWTKSAEQILKKLAPLYNPIKL